MRTNIVALPANIAHKELSQLLASDHNPRGQHLYPVIDAKERLLGVVTRKDLLKLLQEQCSIGEGYSLAELVKPYPVVAHPDEPLRVVVYRMAETGFTRFPVVERDNAQKLVGMISLNDLLQARTRNLAEERNRERVLRIRYPIPMRFFR